MSPLVVAGIVVVFLIISKPSNVASYSSGVLGTRLNIPGIGTYSQTPWGTSVTLAQQLANPIANLLGRASTGPIGAAPAPTNPGGYVSPYDPNLANGGDPSAGLIPTE